MKLPIALSIVVSVVIIGGAIVVRTIPSAEEREALELIATQQKEADEAYYQEFLANLAENTSASSTTQSNPTGAEIIGPQLIKDFLILNSNGQANQENVDLLVQQYIDYIPNLVSVNNIQSTDIKSVPDTLANFQYYNDLMEPIEIERRNSVSSIRSNISKIDGTNQEAINLLNTTASAYEKAVTKARNVPVPTALVSAHVRLLNNFVTTAEGMRTIANINSDPTLAFSGMIKVNNSLVEEEDIVNEIIAILVKNGVQ